MNRQMAVQKAITTPTTLTIAFVVATAFGARAFGQQTAEKLQVRISRATGLAAFVTAADAGPIPVASANGQAKPTPMDFLDQHGHLFGVTDPEVELVEAKVQTDTLGHTHTTYHQVHHGVPVFSGVLKVHQNVDGDTVAANGDFYPVSPRLDTTPTLTADQTVAAARGELGAGEPVAEKSQLVIVDPGWYGDPPIGAHLAYYIILTDLAVPIREAFFVDAHTGAILDQWTVLHTARLREVYDGQGGTGLPGVLARGEGDPPVGSPEDVNIAYDYAGDVYDYFDRAFGRDSIDDDGMALMLTANSTAPSCPNAFWNGTQMVFCLGTVTDDVTAHEIVHGVTEHTADLIYQNQTGQLNESFSDVFGELVDLFNGDVAFPGPPSGPPFWPVHPTGPGLDTPNDLRSTCSPSPSYTDGVRWLVGEDAWAFNGAIRDIWNPTCEGDPDYGNSPLQTCNPFDNGGVHSGSGIPNHAFAILTDGKTFNGQTVTGIGPIKAGAVWYRALTVYLTPAADFEDAYDAFNQAAADLTGTFPLDPRTGSPSAEMFTADDAEQVDNALIAVEMNTEGACGATRAALDPNPPYECSRKDVFFADDFESGAVGWTTVYEGMPLTDGWVLTSGLPYGRPGQAWFCEDARFYMNFDSARYTLESPAFTVPARLGWPTLAFTHYFATYEGTDGGNVKISVDGGPWTLIPESAITYNTYNTEIGFSLNPLDGEPAWSGTGAVWGRSLVDLSGFISGGETIQVSFDFGDAFFLGQHGWYIDDVKVYDCVCGSGADCDDGLFCTGIESCVLGLCHRDDPCPGGYCDEAAGFCPPTAFWDDFENGNIKGWDLYGPGSTAYEGDWVIGDPNGTFWEGQPIQPEDAYEGEACAYTGYNGPWTGHDDIEGGVVYLVSPTIDLSGQSAARLSFARWFCQAELGDDPGDFYTADVSNDNGATWVNLETLDGDQSANTWTLRSFTLEDYVPFTSTMKVRFGASDAAPDGDYVEAAIDLVLVLLPEACDTPAVTAEGSRTVGVTPGPSAQSVALFATGDPGDPSVSCVSGYVQGDGTLDVEPVYQTPGAWNRVHVRDLAIVPEATYEVRADCQIDGNPVLSSTASATTWLWSDVDDSGLVNIGDVLFLVEAFQGNFSHVTLEAADLDPCEPNGMINIGDVLMAVRAFTGDTYTDTFCPMPCP